MTLKKMYSTMHFPCKVIEYQYQTLTDKLDKVGLNPSKFHGGEYIMKKLLNHRKESRMLSVQDVKNKLENLLWFRLDDVDKIQIKFNRNELGSTAYQFPSSLTKRSDIVNSNEIYFWENNETLVINIVRLYSCPDRNKIVGFLENIKKRKSNGESVSIIREELNKYTKRLWKREHDYFKKILKNAEILGIALDQKDYKAFLDPKSILGGKRQVMESSKEGKRKRRIQKEETCKMNHYYNSYAFPEQHTNTNCRSQMNDYHQCVRVDQLTPCDCSHLNQPTAPNDSIYLPRYGIFTPTDNTPDDLPNLDSLQPSIHSSCFLTQPSTNQCNLGELFSFQFNSL